MLDEFQTQTVWENLLGAETRALYFADLTSTYTRRRQAVDLGSFFLASGAAATVVAKLPAWVAVAQASAVALLNAYSIVSGLEKRTATMAKLHASWSRIAGDYRWLWSHLGDADAERRLLELNRQEQEVSELAATDAPNDQTRLGHWQDHVFAMHQIGPSNG